MSNVSTPKLYKDILEMIRLTLPEKYRPNEYSDISGAINLWMESKQKEIDRERELKESAQSVTCKLQDEQEPPLDQDKMREYMRAEHKELMGDVFEMFMYYTKGKRIIIEDTET